jgi:hypothetical protein
VLLYARTLAQRAQAMKKEFENKRPRMDALGESISNGIHSLASSVSELSGSIREGNNILKLQVLLANGVDQQFNKSALDALQQNYVVQVEDDRERELVQHVHVAQVPQTHVDANALEGGSSQSMSANEEGRLPGNQDSNNSTLSSFSEFLVCEE